jgi:hypothetical protein
MSDELRRRVIEEWRDIVDGRGMDERSRLVREAIWRWDDHHLIQLRWLIPQIVDSTLEKIRPR